MVRRLRLAGKGLAMRLDRYIIHNIAETINDRQMTDADKIIDIYRILQRATVMVLEEEV